MPARKVRPSRYSVTGYVSTEKGVRPNESESTLEYDFLTILEYDQRVERYLSQPFSISWLDETGRRRRYTPDVLVKYSYDACRKDRRLKTTIFEVKPEKVLVKDWKELKPKFRAAIRWANDFGCAFHIATERKIRTPYLTNAQFLLDFRSRFLGSNVDLSAARQHLIAETILRLGTTTPRDLLAAMSSDPMQQAELLPWVWNLVNQQFVGVNLHERITMCSPIWPTETTKVLLT